MYLKSIILHNFKNIVAASLEFSPKINYISGNNGAGKTNLLDAVYYLSMTKSFFSSSDRYVCNFDADEAQIGGVYDIGGVEERIGVSIRRGGVKTVRRNGRNYERFSEHIGLLPIVMVSPADTSLIHDSGDERRKYLNFILSQTDRAYLRHIQAYTHLLIRRNRLLKEDLLPDVLLDTIAEQMAPHAHYVGDARRELCNKLDPLVREYYSRLSDGREEVKIRFRTDLDNGDFSTLLQQDEEKERILKYTTVGPQRDDMSFLIEDHPIRNCGSQGQQKSFLLAMKLAQFSFMKSIYSKPPILLLDDLFDKLDMERVESLLKIVLKDDFGQIFISDSNKVRIERLMESLQGESRSFIVENGVFRSLQTPEL